MQHPPPSSSAAAGDLSYYNSNIKEKRPKFFINDHVDILIEILKRLDGRSLCLAASVCRLWCTIARTDSLWEDICFRHVSPPPYGVRHVVLALGGYKRLYMLCIRPALSRLAGGGLRLQETDRVRRLWTRDGVQLSLSLFCVDYYEKLGRHGVGDPSASSLMFLCKPHQRLNPICCFGYPSCLLDGIMDNIYLE